ncbi:uncharacterized protein ACRADG_008617 [Cochliomyia hominivorax]
MHQQKPISHRRAASSFIHDDNEINLIQLSPHRNLSSFEQRSPFTVSKNQESKTNFIGDCLLTSEIPRACVVSKTGEKLLLNIDGSPLAKTSSNPFTLHSPRYSAPAMSKISEKSSSQLSLSPEKLKKSSTKLNKKTKPPKRQMNPKHRLSFTPRNMERNSFSQIPVNHYSQDLSPAIHSKSFEVKYNTSTETQTDIPTFPTNPYTSRVYKPFASYGLSPTTTPRRSLNENLRKDFQKTGIYYTSEPLRIYPKTKSNLKKHAELRSLASAITLITVVSWLFASFVDVECLWNYLNSLWKYFQNWFLTKEKPKTKVELLVTFLHDLWS